MKKITFFIAIYAIIAACSSKGTHNVSGKIDNAADSILYVEATTLEGIKTLDSVKLTSGGTYHFSVPQPEESPEFYILRIGSHYIPFSIDSTESVTINASMPDISTNYTISGNESSQKIKEIYTMQIALQKQIIELEKNTEMFPGDIVDSINAITKAYKETIKTKYIFTDPASASAYYAVCQSITDLRGSYFLFNPLSDRDDVKAYAAVATAWDCYYPDASRTVQICNAAIKGLDNTAEKQPTPIADIDNSKIEETGIIQIELPDINNQTRTLTALKGKVVLLDFTIFSAKESAERTRLLRTLYEKYSPQGFEIYQISLDDDIHFWKSSVEYLPWISVHETNGVATAAYAVSTVPTFFLINRNNEIVVRSDFMEGTLESNIQKLL